MALPPTSFVQLDGAEKGWPADWKITGEAYGLCDWHVTVHGLHLSLVGQDVAVRLVTPLGAFEGRMVMTSASVESAELAGNGLVRITAMALPDPAPASVYVQWKGTDICLDFYCPCGAMPHYDGEFAYVLKCAGCGRLWQMPDTFVLEETGDHAGAVLEESWHPGHPKREGPEVVEVADRP